jgi:hypothetical protein
MDFRTGKVQSEPNPSIPGTKQLASDFHTIRARPIRREHFDAEVRLLAEIFNDAWSENWGFLPFSSREIDLLAAELKMIYRSTYGYFAEINGEPVGMLIGVPNINEVIAPFNGRLTPVNAVKLGWALYRENVRSSRLPMVGLRKKNQSGLQGATLLAAILQAALTEVERRDVDWFELSWVLEDNHRARKFLEFAGCTIAATYRIYEGKLTG